MISAYIYTHKNKEPARSPAHNPIIHHQ